MGSHSPRIAHASAPLRLDFAGGWTDVPPFSAREGGLVVNTTIGLYAHAAVEPGGEGVLLTSEDLQDQLRVSHAGDLTRGGRLALLKSAVRLFPVGPCEVISRSEAPPGSGLGSSGALDVALVSALLRAVGEELDRPAVAHAAWKVEVEDAGMAGENRTSTLRPSEVFSASRSMIPTSFRSRSASTLNSPDILNDISSSATPGAPGCQPT